MTVIDNGTTGEVAAEPFNTTLHDQLSAVYDRMNADDGVKDEPEAVVEGTGERQRGPDGKFVKTEADAPAEITDQAVQEAPAVVSNAPAEPPSSWSAEAKAEWAKLSPALQQAVLKREGEVSEGFKQYGEKVKAYEGIDRAIEPIKAQLQQFNATPAQFVERAVHIDHALKTNGAETIKWLCQQYNIDLGDSTENVDPNLAEIKSELNSLKSVITQSQYQQQQSEQARLAAAVDGFKSNPANVHFAAVEQDMIALMPAITSQMPNASPEEKLKAAYDRAIYFNPEVRAQVLAAEEAKKEEARKKALAERANSARKAADTNVSSKGTAGGSTPKAQSMRQTMEEAYDRATAV